jgi:hypothetical protein
MKKLLLLLFLSPVASRAQSPFDGGWIFDEDSGSVPIPVEKYKGVFS